MLFLRRAELKTFTNTILTAGILLAAILIIPATASAKSMYLTHGNDYEYTIDGDFKWTSPCPMLAVQDLSYTMLCKYPEAYLWIMLPIRV